VSEEEQTFTYEIAICSFEGMEAIVDASVPAFQMTRAYELRKEET